MSKLADRLLAEALFDKGSRYEKPSSSRIEKIVAKVIEKHLLGDEKKKEEKKDGKDKLSNIEKVLLMAFLTWVMGPFILAAQISAISYITHH